MENIETILIDNLNFSVKKAKLYLTLVELGEATVSDIAKISKLKRTTCYNLLPELMEEGFVKASKKGKKNYYLVEDPRRLKLEAEEKLDNVSRILPYLQAVHNVYPYKPKISFFEGVGGMREVYDDISKSMKVGDVILSMTGPSNLDKYIPKEIVKKYVDGRIKKRVLNRMICVDSPVARAWQASSKKELREIKIVDKNLINFQADMKIYGNKISFISYKENYLGVIIESREIVELQKKFFEFVWSFLE